jgi:hypothetical protein
VPCGTCRTSAGGSGGDGVVILRYPTTLTGTIAPGSNVIACAPCSTKTAKFIVTGSISWTK